MFSFGYKCMECSWRINSEKVLYRCPSCGGALEVAYDYRVMKENFITEQFRCIAPKHMKYHFALPLKKPHNAITMGEGGTPLLCIGNNLYAKFEGVNPTGSFKDRGSCVEISKARELGMDTVVCASTGNMGASIAAYAARADMHAVIFTPRFAEKIKLKQMRYYGAEIVVCGDTYSKAMQKSTEYAKKIGGYLTGDYPYRLEGQKTVSYEIADQLGFNPPDNIVIPVGNGTLFYATYKGFKEMRELGLVDRMPRLIAVQAAGCASVVNAYKRKSGRLEQIKNPKTIAGAINCDLPVEGAGILKALRESKGCAVAVSDREMIAAKKALSKKGIYPEVSSAAAYAALPKLTLEGKTVIVVTGFGFKDDY